MSFQDDLKSALVDHLNRSHDSGAYGSICTEDIIDVRVTWDDGDRWDPTYGDSGSAAPTFSVEVLLSDDHHPGGWVSVGPEWTFTALLRAVLAVGTV